MSHTPEPWIVEGTMIVARDCYGPFIADCDQFKKTVDPKRWVGYEQIKANAAVIVERVNGWDALVAERDNLRDHVRILREAAQRVIDNWDGGDLADSVRELSLILEATKVEA